MKKFFKAICLAAALVLLVSFSAFAASIELDTPQVDKAERTATVSGKMMDPAANPQVTIVVIDSTASLSSMTDEDIVYLDQIPVEEDNTFSFSLAIDASKGDKFTAYVGGTQVTAVSSKLINFGSAKEGDVNGDGKVSLQDYQLVVANFGKTTSEGDANGDGKVSLQDYQLVVANFGK